MSQEFCPAHPNPGCPQKEEGGQCSYCGFDFVEEHLTPESLRLAQEAARTHARERQWEADQAEASKLKQSLEKTLEEARRDREASARWETEAIQLKQSLEKTLEEAGRDREASVRWEAEATQLRRELTERQAAAEHSHTEISRLENAIVDKEAELARLGQELGALKQVKRGRGIWPWLVAGALVLAVIFMLIGKKEDPPAILQSVTSGKETKAAYEPEMVAIPGKRFELGRTEVTQGQWRAVMGSNPSRFKECGDDCPVERVSWDDVQEYLKRLNAKTGKQYRLPTEVEWEYGCDGGRRSEYCGGENVDAVGWHEGNSGGKTHPVGKKAANGYGLYDMSGNVWEWTSDCWDGDCNRRVLRGGSWYDDPRFLRSASRDWFTLDNRIDFMGFRIARTLP